MTRWTTLVESIEAARSERKEDWRNKLIVQVKRAVEMKMCAEFEPYRIKQSGRTIDVAKRDGATMRTRKGEVPAITFLDLPALEDARLAFRIALQRDKKRIEQYTFGVVGTERSSGRAWQARIDLDAEQKGGGPCCHAMLHAHVGAELADKGGQEARVPLPWLDPDEALCWLLTTLDPRLEPLA